MGDRYNLIVIGGGAGGLVVAAAASTLGARVALIDKAGRLGGDCLHFGCVPTKSLIRSAKVAHLARRGPEFGLKTTVEVDFPAVMARMRGIVQHLEKNDSKERFEGLGVEVIFGAPRFVGPRTVEVAGRRLEGRKIVIATGSRPVRLPIPGLAEAGAHTNETILSITGQPKRLFVLGGGPIGMEFAQFFQRLGTQVTVVEKMGQILPREEKELADTLETILKREGMDIVTCQGVERIENGAGGKVVHAACEIHGKRSFEVDEILVSIGRAPNVEGLDLEKAGIAYDKKGIRVDDTLRTTNSHVYACGDVTGLYPFTHMAEYEAKTVIRNALFPGLGSIRFKAVPWATFTDPELARCGLTEAEAKEQGHDVRVYRFSFEELDRAVIDGEAHGMVKLVCDAQGRILGAHVLGPEGGELIQELTFAMHHGCPVGNISEVVHIYPTLVQGIRRAADAAFKARLTPFKQGLLRRYFAWIR